ncbi:MAG: 30S ribosomal protein S9 [Candidatus Micrarchaeota archaeon]|nr:30S ribosomal protein S9 [Candidatus Micrarchaeota archaeon]
MARGKRKSSIARATINKGSGKIRINNLSLEAYYTNRYAREITKEAVNYVGPEVNVVDIHVTVYGGGIMGQAQASRTAIAKALVQYFDSQNLKDKFLDIDRSLLIEDVRRVESKKYKGPKARARFQKSYR